MTKKLLITDLTNKRRSEIEKKYSTVFVHFLHTFDAFSLVDISNYAIYDLSVQSVSIVLFIIGLGIAKRASDLFEKKGTNIVTFDEPDLLVAEGIFR